jgi:hypothetical protein
MNTEIQVKLIELAFNRSKPFCYGCYKEAPTGTCKTCGSDDLMRITDDNGPEYGTDWIIEDILRAELEPANTEEAFEQSIADCYSETTKVGWLELDTVSVIKEMDPVSWRCAYSEWESQETDEGNIVSFDNGSTYYWLHDVEALLQ